MNLTNEKFFELLPVNAEDKEVGTTSKGSIDKTGTCYHVTSHSFNDEKIFNFESAQYRENLLFNISKIYGVRIVFSAIQPTHTHDVVLCRNIEDVMKTFRSLNCKVSHFVKSKNPKHYSIPGVRVFKERPAYKAVETYFHLLFLAKYLYDNGEELRKQNKRPPYCCFDELERGFYNNYPKEMYSILFGIDIQKIISNCKSYSKQEFMDFCNNLFKETDKTREKQFFHI